MTKQPDEGWREHVLSTLPKMEATTEPAPTAFTPATDFGPVVFHGDRTPDDPTALLDGLPLVKITALHQRALDLHGAIPSFDDVQRVRLDKNQHANRIAKLVAHRSEGGFGLPEDAPQVVVERKKLERAEQELARLTSLQEIRRARWNAASLVKQSVGDWVLRGVPGDCVLETLEDAPLSELLKKGETIANAVERYRHRLRELAADLHRVRSSPWPSSLAKVAAKELIDRLADQGAPNLDAAIEHGMDIGFATTRLQSMVYNAQPGAVAYAETPDVLGLLAWVLRDQLLAKINAGFDEIADDKSALNQAEREEAEAQINSDMLMTERSECACIWAAETRNNEILDFRSDTTPMAALGVSLRTVPRAALPPTSTEHGYDIVRR